MIRYKVDVMDELKKVGFNSTMARLTKYFSQSTMTKFKNGDANISIENLNRLCTILRKQPYEVIDYVLTDEDKQYLIECNTKITAENKVDFMVDSGTEKVLVEKS